MLSALAALTFIQFAWIKDAISINNKHFNNVVNSVLADVCKDIETNETIYKISNEVYSYKDITTDLQQADNYSFLNRVQLPDSNTEFYYSKQATSFKDKHTHVIDTTIKAYIGDSLVLNKSNKYTDVKKELVKTSDLEKHINHTVGKKALFVEKIVNSLLDYNEDINERVSKNQVKSLLNKYLAANDIDINYEFSVYEDDEIPVFCSDKFNGKECDKTYSHRLFPNDIRNSNYYLLVNFPTKSRYIVKSLWVMASSSMLVILIILTIFTLTLIIIFKQKKLSEMKNDFVSNMTHELKTPISTISLASQMLGDEDVHNSSQQITSISNIIKQETNRLSIQVEKVLQTSILDKGLLKLKLENVDIHQIIQGVFDNFNIRVKNEDGEFVLNLQAKHFEIMADRLHITNVLVNLTENALKYKNEKPKITISTKSKAEFIYISVIDNGIGISKDDQKRVFEQFFRVSTGNIHDVKGFGLGLSYVKKIVEGHNGEIKLESKLKKGSTFTIKLPVV